MFAWATPMIFEHLYPHEVEAMNRYVDELAKAATRAK